MTATFTINTLPVLATVRGPMGVEGVPWGIVILVGGAFILGGAIQFGVRWLAMRYGVDEERATEWSYTAAGVAVVAGIVAFIAFIASR